MPVEIEIITDDITRVEADAIVNAANKTLLGGGGVDGAIHRVAGHRLLEECRLLNGCETGEAKMTKGYNLPASYVIHTVGPVWRGGKYGEDLLLENCYRNSILLARKFHFKTIAFPAISTGIYGFPLERATRIAFSVAAELTSGQLYPAKVIFVCFSAEDFELYEKLSTEYF